MTVDYGAVRALSSIDLEVRRGEIVCIMGVNGAGKTTLLKAISGLVPWTAGDILIDGTSIRRMKPWNIAKRGVAHVPEGRRCFGQMSVENNLVTGGFAATGDGEQLGVDVMYEMFPVLKEKRHQPAATLSGGQQQMLAIARGLMANPQVLMLDEPSLGLAPIVVSQVRVVLKEVVDRFNVAMILVEQSTPLALPVSDRGYVMSRGNILASGQPSELRGIIEASYLGS